MPEKNIINSASRINTLAKHYEAENYLEIGVSKGETFFAVEMPRKVAVGPNFRFEPKEHEAPGRHFFPMTSDAFFAALPERGTDNAPLTAAQPGGKPVFDIIFIDGLHTFEQSLRDFENSLAYSHENTIWLLDDTVPCDAYSAIPDHQQSLALRKAAGLYGGPWHGDVFKTVFAIHDRYPEFSYCTLMGGNPQTVVWRQAQEQREGQRTPAFSSLEEISRLDDYFDMLKHATLLLPVKDDMLLDMIGMSLEPKKYGLPDDWKKLQYRKVRTDKEILLTKQNKEAHARLAELTQQLETSQFELAKTEQELTAVQEKLKALEDKRTKQTKHLDQQQERLEKTQADLARLRDSLSWRLTSPLRALSRAFKTTR